MTRAIPLEQDLFEFAIGGKIDVTTDKYKQVIELMMMDKNYSVAKEKITCYLAGVNHNPAKHDYDGKAFRNGRHRPVEVKPTSYWGKTKLSMKCAFGDYSMERFDRDKREDLLMVVAGFNRTRLIYGLEFDFNSKPFLDAIQAAIEKVIQAVKSGASRPGTRIIPSPSINVISQIENINILYPSSDEREVIEKNKDALNRQVYEFLMARI